MAALDDYQLFSITRRKLRYINIRSYINNHCEAVWDNISTNIEPQNFTGIGELRI